MEGFEADLARLITGELLGNKGRVEFIKILSFERVFALKENRVDLVFFYICDYSRTFRSIRIF